MDDLKHVYEAVCRRLLEEEDPDLGEIEFSSIRSDGVSTTEPDTPYEETVRQQITAWLKHRGDMKGPGGAEDIRRLMRHPKYSRFFKSAEPGVEIYRGVAMTPGQLSRMLGLQLPQMKTSGKKEGTFTGELSRGRAAASWTYELTSAERFAEDMASEAGSALAVVWTANTDDNPGILLDLWRMLQVTRRSPTWKNYINEAEVLALGPVAVSSVSWWPVDAG